MEILVMTQVLKHFEGLELRTSGGGKHNAICHKATTERLEQDER